MNKEEDLSTEISPPKNAVQFLQWYCGSSRAEEIEGDLEEYFFDNLEEYGEKKAKKLYWWDVIRCCKPYAWKNKIYINRR